jgi:hypothetical protein
MSNPSKMGHGISRISNSWLTLWRPQRTCSMQRPTRLTLRPVAASAIVCCSSSGMGLTTAPMSSTCAGLMHDTVARESRGARNCLYFRGQFGMTLLG